MSRVCIVGALTIGCGSDVRPGPVATGGAAGMAGVTGIPDASTGGAGGTDAGLGGSPIGPTLCGNGMVDTGEDCDDGNSVNKDGCETNCRFTCTQGTDAPCSDGNYCNGPETCDDTHHCQPSAGPLADGTVCGDASKCSAGVCGPAAPDCGDGLIERPDEECEDGNTVNGDGCDSCRFTCVSKDSTRNCASDNPCPGIPACDDNTHTCKRGSALTERAMCADDKICVNDVCTGTYCGNGKLDGTEECDDGNTVKGDGCEPDCTFSCVPGVTGRDCQSTNVCIDSGTCNGATHVCTPLLPKAPGTTCNTSKNCVQGNCIAPVCGDGIKAAGEACDDGNASNTDACTGTCTPVCGSAGDCSGRAAVPCRTAACPAGACTTSADASKNGQACTTSGGTGVCHDGACTDGTCGDGLSDQGEQCDDNNKTDGDGCDSDCMYTCQADTDCDDKNACNGVEKCLTVPAGKKCGIATPALADGASCATGKLCSSSICRASFCGDGYTDKAAGETCDPPNTTGCDANCKALTTCQISGNWAMKVAVKVTWSGGALVDGQGEIDQWALLKIQQDKGSTAFTASVKACEISIPDFHTIPSFGDETYGITFPTSAFDSTKIPTVNFSGQLGNLAPGASFQTTSAAVLLGLDVKSPASPVGQWPNPVDMTAANGYTITDVDGDGNPGITANVKTGTIPGTGMPYKDIIWQPGSPSLDTSKRAKTLFLVIRQIAAENGTLNSCTELSGSTTAVIDNHILGCVSDVAGDTSCKPDLLDVVRPIYTAQSGTFAASQIGTQEACSAVRAKVP
ncbi:MAG TPA: DUF4215 domain-containing protein [Polyangiaceae bacterium]|nr:DUF4215 domain-containing protein [Polyangiaceae bacterium]